MTINENGPVKKKEPEYECPCCFTALQKEDKVCPGCNAGIAKGNNLKKTMTENPYAKTYFGNIRPHTKHYRD